MGREEKGEGGDRGHLVEKKESQKGEKAIKHNHEHKSKFMDVFQFTFKMNSINFIPKIVKILVIMQPVGEHYFIVDREC